MGLREMQDGPLLRVAERPCPFAEMDREDYGLTLWDAAVPWLQVVAVLTLWGLLIWYGPRALAMFGLWLSR